MIKGTGGEDFKLIKYISTTAVTISLTLLILTGCAAKKNIIEKKIDFLCCDEEEIGKEKKKDEYKVDRERDKRNNKHLEGKTPMILEYETLKGELNVRTYEEMFDKAMQLYSEGKISESARIFQVLVENSPSSDYKEVASFNLGIAMERLGEEEKAQEIYTDLILSPQYEIRADAFLRFARIKISQGEDIHIDEKRFYDEERKNFAKALKILQQTEKIISETYEKKYGKKDDISEEIRGEENTINLGENGDEDKSIQQIEDEDKGIQQIKDIEQQIKDIEKEIERIITESHEVKSVLRLCKGNINFIRAIITPNYPTEMVEMKVKYLLSAQKEYFDVVKNSEAWWMTAGVFKIGEIYKYLFEDLANSPAPQELKTEEEKEIYRQELIKELKKALKIAQEIYEKNISFAQRIKLQTVWVKKSQKELERIKKYLEIAKTMLENKKEDQNDKTTEQQKQQKEKTIMNEGIKDHNEENKKEYNIRYLNKHTQR